VVRNDASSGYRGAVEGSDPVTGQPWEPAVVPRNANLDGSVGPRYSVSLRRALLAGGLGLTTLLVVGGLLTVLLPFEFSALVGLPVGVLAGLFAVVLALGAPLRSGTPAARAVAAAATVGYVVLGLAALSYANVAGFRGTLSVTEWLVVAILAGLAVYAGLWLRYRRPGSPT